MTNAVGILKWEDFMAASRLKRIALELRRLAWFVTNGILPPPPASFKRLLGAGFTPPTNGFSNHVGKAARRHCVPH